MTENEIKVLRMNLLGGMHNYMMHVVQDEDLQDTWLVMGVPDEPSEEDLEFIAEDAEEFSRVVRLFGNLVWTDEHPNWI
jgi:hypothetical protein